MNEENGQPKPLQVVVSAEAHRILLAAKVAFGMDKKETVDAAIKEYDKTHQIRETASRLLNERQT